jgi:hypothetical protein
MKKNWTGSTLIAGSNLIACLQTWMFAVTLKNEKNCYNEWSPLSFEGQVSWSVCESSELEVFGQFPWSLLCRSKDKARHAWPSHLPPSLGSYFLPGTASWDFLYFLYLLWSQDRWFWKLTTSILSWFAFVDYMCGLWMVIMVWVLVVKPWLCLRIGVTKMSWLKTTA